jgi:ubiquinone/menaquinone biosynthesis C-methylase UbiE
MSISRLYARRFDDRERLAKHDLWKTLCKAFLQKYVPPDSAVLDIGAGYCEFINNISAGRKYAVDPNEDARGCADAEVKVFNGYSTDLSFLADSSIDVVFMSNLLEHLPTKQDVAVTLSEAHRVLKPRGRLLLLQPNIRYLYKDYWDFFDHHIPLSDRSLAEALKMAGFSIEKLFSKFLPYTTKSGLPKKPFLLKIYLKVPFLWKLFGKQMFIVSRKDA